VFIDILEDVDTWQRVAMLVSKEDSIQTVGASQPTVDGPSPTSTPSLFA